jgi:hypothetical protein
MPDQPLRRHRPIRAPRAWVLLACALTLIGVQGIEFASAVFRDTVAVGANTVTARNSFGLVQSSTTSGCISEDGTSGTCIDGVGLKEPAGVAVTSDGEFLYAATYATDGVAAFDRDPATGALRGRFILMY